MLIAIGVNLRMTKNDSLEKFYARFSKLIALAASFTEKPELSKIIRMCRLKPYNVIFEGHGKELVLHYRWIDEYGNSLIINQDKSLEIKLGDAVLDRSRLVETDLYGQLSVEKISSISNFLFFLDGKDEDTLMNHSILSFHGIDSYLRTFVTIYGEWCRYPSLFLGIETLTSIVDNLSLGSYKEINVNRVIYPCDSQRAWLTSWPTSNDFVSIMGKQNESVVTLLNLHKGN